MSNPVCYGGSIYDDCRYSAFSERDVRKENPADFVTLLEMASKERIGAKEERPLICASFIQGTRAQAHASSSGVWLDHDGKGGITPPAILSSKLPTPCAHVAFNTYSYRPEFPKYRVWLPMTRMVSAAEYKMVWTWVMDGIALKGGNGFDRAPSNAISLFYLPAVAGCGERMWQVKDGPLLDPEPIVHQMSLVATASEHLGAVRAKLSPPPSTSSASDVAAALERIDPTERDTWFKVGCALHRGFGDQGKPLWDQWSMRASEKYKPRDQDATWRNIASRKVSNPITLGTLFALARKGGYETA